MNRSITASVSILLATCFILFFSACKKSNSSTAPSFTWTHNDTTHTANLHKAYLRSMAGHPVILAVKGTSLRMANVALHISSFDMGTYTVDRTSHFLNFVDLAGNEYIGLSGSITITAYQNNKISGNFSGIIRHTSEAPRPIFGSFNDTPVEP